MSLRINSDFNGVTDPDAGAYIAAVEAADGNQLLEFGVGKAINDFVVGCKADKTWNAIKASCILSGARTLSGALVPLSGTAPTNFNFVSGDYDRKTGLVGNGSTKYLDSNRANNADPQNNCHLSVWLNDTNTGSNPYFIGASSSGYGFGCVVGINGMYSNSTTPFNAAASVLVGLHGHSRTTSASVTGKRPGGVTQTFTNSSSTPTAFSHYVFQLNNGGSLGIGTTSRLTFYSIGESLDLALLDARVTRLIAETTFTLNTGLTGTGYNIDTLNYINAGYAAGGTLA